MATWEAGFINSNRGHYILAQALMIAIEELQKVEGVMQEKSNIADMQYLLDNYLNTYQEVIQSSKEWMNLFFLQHPYSPMESN